MFKKLREQCWKANLELPKLGLVIYTFGNVSSIDRNRGVFAIKPSGVDYDRMEPKDMVIVDLDGNVVDGELRPSTHAVAWAQALRPVPIYGTTHADHLAGDIPCTPLMADERIANDYETETGNQIVESFRAEKLNPDGIQMVVVAGHGPFTWGVNAEKAVYHAKVLEELCRMAYLTERINPDAPRLKASLIEKHYSRKHGKNAYYGQKN